MSCCCQVWPDQWLKPSGIQSLHFSQLGRKLRRGGVGWEGSFLPEQQHRGLARPLSTALHNLFSLIGTPVRFGTGRPPKSLLRHS